MPASTRNLTLLLTDIKGFTSKVSRKTRDEIQRMLDLHRAIVLPILKGKGGRLIKTIGDAFLMTFESPTDAVLAGIAVQETLALHNRNLPEEERFEIRIAVNQGEVVLADDDVFGEPVNITARVEAQTDAGEVFFTEAVYLSMNRAEVPCREVGFRQLKGIPEMVRIYRAALATETAPPAGCPTDGSLPEAARPAPSPGPADPLVGRTVGHCRIEVRLGRGAMGPVYRGRHLVLDRPAAVKMIPAQRLAEDAAAFLSAARRAARLEEPRIARIHEAGVDGDWTYVVMQLVGGQTLEERVSREGAFAPAQALRVVKEIVQGLAAAHSQGLAHGDLKPRHVRLQPDGAVVLMDFGLRPASRAEALPQKDTARADESDFTAPEQSSGRQCDPSADIYSVGAIYYYALTGRPPYLAEDPGRELREMSSQATKASAELIRRLMSRDPAARPSAQALLRALDAPRLLADSAAGAPRASAEVKPEPAPAPAAPTRRGSLAWRLAGTAGCLVGFGRLWLRVCNPDWAAAGAFFAAAGALIFARTASRPRTRGMAAIFSCAIMAAAFYRYGAGSFALPPGQLGPGAWAFAGLGLAAMGASLFFGLRQEDLRRRGMAQSLLCGGAVFLFLAACSLRLPPGAGWLHGVCSAVTSDWKAFLASGGAWRWGPLFLLWLA